MKCMAPSAFYIAYTHNTTGYGMTYLRNLVLAYIDLFEDYPQNNQHTSNFTRLIQ